MLRDVESSRFEKKKLLGEKFVSEGCYRNHFLLRARYFCQIRQKGPTWRYGDNYRLQ